MRENLMLTEKNKATSICISGFDSVGEPSILELPDNWFYLVILFVPQVISSREAVNPLFAGFIEACQSS